MSLNLRVNDRLRSIEYVAQAESIIESYNEDNPQEEISVSSKILLDQFPAVKDFFDALGLEHSDKDILYAANYIFRFKGSVESLQKLFDITGVVVEAPGIVYEKRTLTMSLSLSSIGQLSLFDKSLKQLVYRLLLNWDLNFLIERITITFNIKNFDYRKNSIRVLVQVDDIELV